jgi:Fe-S-cluster containining protein
MEYVNKGAANLLSKVSPESQQIFLKGVQFYIDQFKKMIKQHNAASMIYSVMLNIDASQRKGIDKRVISCKKGCAFCCHYVVDMTLTEAQIIVEYCKEKGIEIDKEKLATQQPLSTTERPKHKDSACVFLSPDNSCKIYDVRPIACRMQLVVTAPKYCDASEKTRKVGWISEANSDMQVSAIGNLGLESGNMSEMILKAMK